MAPITENPESSTRREDAPDFYLAYLNSSAWRMRRNAALRRANYRCQKCGSKRDPNVHHKSYAHLGAEPDADLEVLCFTCHRGHHRAEAAHDELGIYLKIVSTALQEDPFARIADLSEAVKTCCAKLKIPVRFGLIHKAIQMETGSRLYEAKREPYRSVVDVEIDTPPPTQAQAIEFLTRLKLPLRGPGAVVKAMPKARLVTQHRADQLKAFAMVTAEMEASIARCEALEAEAVK